MCTFIVRWHGVEIFGILLGHQYEVYLGSPYQSCGYNCHRQITSSQYFVEVCLQSITFSVQLGITYLTHCMLRVHGLFARYISSPGQQRTLFERYKLSVCQ